eukprot:CAMPEP_0168415888 /NCGR_PEP_ID=MMETSP0228-20121227/30463_1 /TAXON_ID=133427 /ORGANISM="Protoceratium reticulatum, Strain CCCM 535 (=CCMP 1889)" /LENGTH=470 /DNA_ID=CAMNT_0008429709 /DNA_START=102 /DNA_END=1514 /DNA_ORIENTATION=-
MARAGDADIADQIKKCFRQFDIDGNGAISRVELQAVLERLCSSDKFLTKDDIDMCMSQADTNENGVIEYDEFVDWLMLPGSQIQARKSGVALFDFEAVLRPLFDVFDRNGNGLISFEEFEEIFCILQNAQNMGSKRGNPMPGYLTRESTNVFKHADSGDDCHVDFKEFVAWQRQALQKSGLLNEDLRDLVPALARQLDRIFKFSEAQETGHVSDDDERVLKKVIENLSNFTRDLWNQDGAAHSSLRGKHHFTNRWSEPPAGMNMERLLHQHFRVMTVQLRDLARYDLQVLCLPEAPKDSQDAVPQARRWIARVSQGLRAVQDDQTERQVSIDYYVHSNLSWKSTSNADKLFTESLDSFSPEMRFFCLLKTQANFGTDASWATVLVVLNNAVDFGFLSEEQKRRYIEYVEAQVLMTVMKEEEGSIKSGDLRAKAKHMLETGLRLTPRSIMTGLVDLGVYQVSSKLADVLGS